jgi:AraC-like DNA-binding protein
VINPDASQLGKVNAILQGRNRHYFVGDFPGPLSIKTTVYGKGAWETGRNRFEVDGDSFVVLNRGQTYSLVIDSPQPTQTFCLFFKDNFVEDAWRCHTTTSSVLLDDPFVDMPAIGFFERLHAKDGAMNGLLARMQRKIVGGHTSHESLEDDFVLAARELLRLKSELCQEAARVPAIRASTKAELFRRLTNARSIVEGSLDQPVHLDRIAVEACLSPYHLHRLFTRVFGETPHRYAVRRRMERAKRLLAWTDMPVTLVCLESGFQSLGSFSSLFRKLNGLSPRQFRLRQ